MVTYYIWKSYIDDFNRFTTNFEKISTYAFLVGFSIITICIDITSLPFQLIGLIIFFITKLISKLRKKGK